MTSRRFDARSAVAGAIVLAAAEVVVGVAFWAGRRSAPETPPMRVEPSSQVVAAPSTTVVASEPVDACATGIDEPMVCITAVERVGDDIVVHLDHRNIPPSAIGVAGGYHAHLFAGDQPVEWIGVRGEHSTGGGEWQVTDATAHRLTEIDRPLLTRSGEICVATADRNHTLVHLHASCASIPGED